MTSSFVAVATGTSTCLNRSKQSLPPPSNQPSRQPRSASAKLPLMLSNVMTHAATTVSLADYTRPELIVPQLRERDTAGIIGELGRVLQRHGCVPDILPFYQAAL